MKKGDFIRIDQKCPACSAKLPCDVRVRLGFGLREPDYPVDCPTCHERVRLDLPGPPFRVHPPEPPPPKFRQGLRWLGKEILRIGLREAIREILDAMRELFRRRAARAGV